MSSRLAFSLLILSIAATLSAGCGGALAPKTHAISPVCPGERRAIRKALESGESIFAPPTTTVPRSSIVPMPLESARPSPTPVASVTSRPSPSPLPSPLPSPSIPTSPLLLRAPERNDVTSAPFPELSECEAFRMDLPASFQQGFIDAPEDWDQPERGPKIRVFYYARLKHDAATGAVIQPVLYLNGGPAADSHGGYRALERKPEIQAVSMIYLDQRGTGCSTGYPYPATAQRLASYASRAIVRDAERVRAQLLGPQSRWSLLAQSYGGAVAHRYLELAPERVATAQIYHHAVTSDPITKVVERLKAQPRVSDEYFRLYPQDRAQLRSLRASIPAQQCYSDGAATVCGPAVLDALMLVLSYRTQWAGLHRKLGELAPSSGQTDPAQLEDLVRTTVFGLYGGASPASAVLSYLEITPGFTDAAACDVALERLARQGISPDAWDLNECRLLQALRGPADEWTANLPARGDPLSLPLILKSLTQNAGIELHLFAGEKDVLVPPAVFHEETSALGRRARYRVLPGVGHELSSIQSF